MFEGLPPRVPALVDLGQPEMRQAGVQEISVGQSPVPGQSVLMTSKLVEQLGAGESLMELDEERRVALLVHA